MGLVIILIGVSVYCCYMACKKRSEIQHGCPRCGNLVNASPWSTGLKYKYGGYLHNFKCKNCGHKFME